LLSGLRSVPPAVAGGFLAITHPLPQVALTSFTSKLGTSNSKLPTSVSNEDLIYRITKAVYHRLGTGADEQTVEQLVTEIYREIQPYIGTNNGSSYSASPYSSSATTATSEGSSERMIISVFGVDHPGIVAAVSQILAEANCSIVDINQTVVQSKFAMIIIANIARAKESAADLKERLRREGEKLGVRIYAQREDLFNSMHRI
jgi:ACT domain-containing protein